MAVGEKPLSKDDYAKILRSNYKKSSMYVLDTKGFKGFLWFVKKDNEINLEEIFVLEKNKGFGKELMGFLIDYAKKNKIKKINLDVHYRNKRAIDFFKLFGFTERTSEMSLDLE